jgi:hypothetical protein
MIDEQQKRPKDEPQKTPTSGRTLRRLRAQFRVELLGKAKPTPSDQTLIDLAAQAALRVREMRAEIAAGNRVPHPRTARRVSRDRAASSRDPLQSLSPGTGL